MKYLIAFLFACTPAEQQASAVAVEDAAKCIEANAVSGADPAAVALKCSLQEVPDIIALVTSVIEAKTLAQKCGTAAPGK